MRIDAIEVTDYDYPRLELDIMCGGGTYIRSLGRDLAESLGTMAVMNELRRTAVGIFSAIDAVPPDDLLSGNLAIYLRPPIEAVAELPRHVVTAEEAGRLSNGQPIRHPGRSEQPGHFITGAEWAAVDSANRLLALLKVRDDGQLWPLRNFVPAEVLGLK